MYSEKLEPVSERLAPDQMLPALAYPFSPMQQEALQDMTWAEENRYPIALRHKLLVRRCRCHLMLGDIEKAREVLDACVGHLHSVPEEAKSEG